MNRLMSLLFVILVGTLPVRTAEEPVNALPPLAPVVIGKPSRIEVHPSKVELASARQQVQLVVTGHYEDGSIVDLTRAAEIVIGDLKVASVQGGVLAPVGDGKTTATVRVDRLQAVLTVNVSGQDKGDPISFHYGAIPALTKQGCNAGSCHGSPSGKGNFSLSMLGYDSDSDLTVLVRSDRGRRLNVMEPEKSLLLRKPTMAVSHGGGQRLLKTDAAYDVLRRWIQEGAKSDAGVAPKLSRVEVYPEVGRIIRKPAHTQQLSVLAYFSDGSVRDVTPLASYSTSDEQVAVVSPSGQVIGKSRGIAAISVRFLEEVITRPFTFVEDLTSFSWNNPKSNNYVDDLVYEQLKLLNFLPADTCGDEQFLRRVYLDVIGLLPTIEETKAFLKDTSTDKRAKLIDQLLERPEFAKFWGQKTADLLRVNPKRLTDEGAKKYNDWIVKAVAENMPYDKFVTALLTADGDTFENPPANYYRAAEDTATVTETTSQLFMGIRISCAKCHNHPFERWTQDNYYGIGAVFHRVQRDGKKDPKRKTATGAAVISVALSGEIKQPRTGHEMKPWLPLLGEVNVPPNEDRRAVFARWLTKPDNPFFARVEVNRIWAHLLGRGIVDPVDDFRESNPASNPKLLDALAKDFVEHGYDRKRMIRVILNSRTYQQKADRNPLNQGDDRFFTAARVRLLSAEQVLDAVSRVTGLQERLSGVPEGTWATQMPVPNPRGFLAAFGQPPRESSCQCERSNDPTLEQALQLLNGPTVQKKVQASNNRIQKMLKANESDEAIIEDLYLAAFCRKPTAEEMTKTKKYLASQDDRGNGLEDILWAIMNTREFVFQH